VDIPEIDVEELARLQTDGVHVVDVRGPDEYRAGHVPGARLLPMDEVPERIEEIPAGETVYFVCGGGGRSHRVCEYLAAQDFDVVNVAGGTRGWIAAGHPVVTGDESG
jgi:rhodanese-related sulfurtransferase